MALLEPTRTDLDIESLLPVVYRIHDEARRRPLASLLEVIGEQAGLVKGNIDDLWDDFFIETCADWVIPYIGDLVGNNLLPGRIRRPRADVAKTIYYRRRKGTLPMLEELARDVTLWRAHAVPFFELANWTQNLNHLRFHPRPEPRPPRPRGLVGTASVRDPETAELVDGPFDVTSHSVDIRPVARREGWPALRRLGFFLWRLGGYPLVGVKPRTGPKPHLFHFNPLGLQTQLFTSAAREAAETELAEEVHVPAPIRRIAFHRQLRDYYGHVSTGSDATRSRSVAVYRGKAAAASTLVPPEKVVARNLSKWENAASLPAVGEVAIDVRLGRLAFNEADVPADVRVSYTYGFSADIGGGPYTREIVSGPSLWTKTVRQTGNANFDSVAAAVLKWESEGRPSGTITIVDSATYDEAIELSVADRGTLTIQAHDGVRPHLVLPAGLDVSYGGPAAAETRDASLTLSGLLVEGPVLVGPGCLRELRISHSTLVPGRRGERRRGQGQRLDAGGGRLEHRRSAARAGGDAGPDRHGQHHRLGQGRSRGDRADAGHRELRAHDDSGARHGLRHRHGARAAAWVGDDLRGQGDLAAEAGGVRALQLRPAGLADPAALPLLAGPRAREQPAEARARAHPAAPAPSLHLNPLRRARVWAARIDMSASDQDRRGGRRRDGRLQSAGTAAAGGQPASASRGIHALRPRTRRHPRHVIGEEQ